MTVRSWLVWPRLAWPLELAILVIGDVVYERIRAMAPTRAALAFSNADRLLTLEPVAVQRFETWLNRLDADHGWLATGTGYFYFTLHLPVTAALLIWLWWRRPALYPVARGALLLLTYGALAFFWLLPVAPPRLAVPGTFDTLAMLNLGTEPGQTHGLVNEFAAFPSLHVGWSIWCAWAVLVGTRHRGRALAVLYPGVTTFVVIATANHYLVDVVAGALGFALAVAMLPAAAPAPADRVDAPAADERRETPATATG